MDHQSKWANLAPGGKAIAVKRKHGVDRLLSAESVSKASKICHSLQAVDD